MAAVLRWVRDGAVALARAVGGSTTAAARAVRLAVLAVGRGIHGGVLALANALRAGLSRLGQAAVEALRALVHGAEAVTLRPARGLLTAVARASLRAQDLADARAARRRPKRTAPSSGMEAATAGRPAADAAVADGDRALAAAWPPPAVRDVARRSVQVAGAVAVIAVLMGVGRSDVTATLSADMPAAAQAPAVEPAVEADGAGGPVPSEPDATAEQESDDRSEPQPEPDPQPDPQPEPEPASGAAPSVPASELDRDGRPARPLEVRLPALRVTAPLVDVGVEPDGAMEIPEHVRTVGWYEPAPGAGVVPGEDGTAVLAGHVDSRVQGPGAFWALRDLVATDRVEVVHEDGSVSLWEVTEVIRDPKTEVPIEDIFVWSGPKRLALVTCGGEFDRSIGSYLDNYVVMARPVAVGLLDAAPGSGLAGSPPGGADGT